jgi:type IV secretion system protein VirB4
MGEGDAVLKTSVERPDAQYQKASRPLAEIVPWMSMLTDNIILCKDGTLLACMEFEAVDLEGAETLSINTLSERMETAMRAFDSRTALWWTVDRRKTTDYVGGDPIENPTAAEIDRLWRTSFQASKHYINRHYLSVVIKPEEGTGRFFETYGRLSTQGIAPFKALIETIKISLRSKDRFIYEAEEIARIAMELESRIQQFLASLPDIKTRRLNGSRLLGFLHRLVSPSSTQDEVRIDPEHTYLDTMLGDAPVEIHGKHLSFLGHPARYGVAASIKNWPSETQPGILDVLLKADAEFTLTMAYRVLDNEQAKKYIADLRRHNANFSKSLFAYIKETLLNRESDNVDNTRLVSFIEADEAMTDLGMNGSAGYLLVSLVVYGDTRESAEAGYNACMKLMQAEGFLMYRESLHLLSAWAGSLPGQLDEPVRWVFVSGANHADLAPLRGLKTGSRISKYLTQQRQRETPALAVFDTEFKTPFFFSFHETDLPHGMVIGPSRSGKSIFNTFLISQWQRYAPCQVFIFDKDLTCRIPTYMHGGTHLWLGKEKVKINPLAGVESESDRTWLAQWVESMITSTGYHLTADDSKDIWNAIERAFHPGTTNRRLSTLSVLLPSHLARQIQAWVGSGQKAGYFDHERDAFELSSFTTMEMNTLFEDPVAARLFLDYAFHRIQKRLDGSPTLIYIEEAWFMLEDQRFAFKVNDWLRTLAKKNAMLLLATQSLEELAKSSAFVAMVDNIPNRIFLPNPNARASADLYMKRFGLNAEQVERIRTAIPKRQYYISTPTMSRMVEAKFPPGILAFLRSDAHAQKIFDETRQLFPEKWRSAYYDRIKEEN